MMNEHSGISRRKLLRTTAIGVPAAGLLAFGSTLVTAPAANADITIDGYWGPETSKGIQNFMNLVYFNVNLEVDGVISSQPSGMKSSCPGITGGWEWVSDDQAQGSPTLFYVSYWLGEKTEFKNIRGDQKITQDLIKALQSYYKLPVDGRLEGPSSAIEALQKEINSAVGNY
ncbi:chemotaxis protein CheA [Rothia sp. HMSC071F11]|uniref:chemotaxis protein CheA n=1 Tax=Rothia sp. HMSC071F11 TaxID=1715034 RepID=UPI0008A1F8FE|nr:chemotaxis protein CheA [Rothia sp. HMSC071F11]OFN46533.1 chemotaxis protein CheA [Rothia sp. HMSC071F11]